MQNFRKLAQLDVPKNRVELCQSLKTGKIQEKNSKIEKPTILIQGIVIRKAHAKFQEASSLGNTQKSRGLYMT